MLTTRPGHSVTFNKRRLFNEEGGWDILFLISATVNTSCSEHHTARNVKLRDFTLKTHRQFQNRSKRDQEKPRGGFRVLQMCKDSTFTLFQPSVRILSRNLGRDRIIWITARAVTEAWCMVGLRDRMNGMQKFNSHLKKKKKLCPTALRFSNIPEHSFVSLSQEKEGKSCPRRPPAVSDV